MSLVQICWLHKGRQYDVTPSSHRETDLAKHGWPKRVWWLRAERHINFYSGKCVKDGWDLKHVIDSCLHISSKLSVLFCLEFLYSIQQVWRLDPEWEVASTHKYIIAKRFSRNGIYLKPEDMSNKAWTRQKGVSLHPICNTMRTSNHYQNSILWLQEGLIDCSVILTLWASESPWAK